MKISKIKTSLSSIYISISSISLSLFRPTSLIILLLTLIFEKTSVHQLIIIGNQFQNLFLTGFNNMSSNNHFFKNKISLMEIKNQIKLADISKISIKYLYEMMDNVQYNQFIIFFFNTCYEI